MSCLIALELEFESLNDEVGGERKVCPPLTQKYKIPIYNYWSVHLYLLMWNRKEYCTIRYHTIINEVYGCNEGVVESNSTCSTVSSCIS